MDGKAPVKVLFVACLQNPLDHNAGSGVDYDLYHGLLHNGADVSVVGPFTFSQTRFERLARAAHSLVFKRRPLKYPVSFLNAAARGVEAAIAEQRPDVIFSRHLMILSRVQTDVPLVVCADTTLYGNQQDWPMFSLIPYLRQEKWERGVYDRASKVIMFSRWSADILGRHYRQPAEKVAVLPIPASIPLAVVPEQPAAPALSPLKILLVGRDAYRKGIDIAIEAVEQLNRDGVPAELRIVGLDGASDEYIRFMGLYNKTVPEELQDYVDNYRWANFLIHPARFEAAGIVPAEAAAFGVPTVTNDVGGLATTVDDGVSGVVLPKHSPPEAYAAVFKRYALDPTAYQALRRSTRRRYENELNWDVAGRQLYEIVSSALR